MAEKGPSVSVIMRTKNSAGVVEQALAALFSQEQRDFELLVVDSASTDRTLEIVRAYPCRLIEIAARDYYPGAVLNRAIEATTGDLLVFQNSDTVPLSPRALGDLVGVFADPEVQAAFGRQLPRPEAHTWVRRDYEVAFPAAPSTPDWLPYALPFAAMRRSAWKEHPFYSEAWGSEDTEWGFWARRQGRRIAYVASAVVMHSHNYRLRQLYGRRFIEGEADAFIHADRLSAGQTLWRFALAAARDVPYHLARRDLPGLAGIPARRGVYHWAYYRGHKLGERRRRTGDTDTSVGQSVVLDSYDR
jgi:rhamnosyltransferase